MSADHIPTASVQPLIWFSFKKRSLSLEVLIELLPT